MGFRVHRQWYRDSMQYGLHDQHRRSMRRPWQCHGHSGEEFQSRRTDRNRTVVVTIVLEQQVGRQKCLPIFFVIRFAAAQNFATCDEKFGRSEKSSLSVGLALVHFRRFAFRRPLLLRSDDPERHRGDRSALRDLCGEPATKLFYFRAFTLARFDRADFLAGGSTKSLADCHFPWKPCHTDCLFFGHDSFLCAGNWKSHLGQNLWRGVRLSFVGLCLDLRLFAY